MFLIALFYIFFSVTVEMLFDSIHKENSNNLFDVLSKVLFPKIAAKKIVCLRKVRQS